MIQNVPSGGFLVNRAERQTFRDGDVREFQLMSDLHIGAASVDYGLIYRELDEAREHGRRVLINGDVFDLILPKDHKRYDPRALHPRLQNTAQVVNATLRMGVDVLGPYADLIDMIGIGNHEAAIERHHSVDIAALLIRELEQRAKRPIYYGGYIGATVYTWKVHGGESRRCLKIAHYHGKGGSAPITKGMIDFHRMQWMSNADVVWLGHKHNRFAHQRRRLEIPHQGDAMVLRDVWEVMTGGYFKTYEPQSQQSVRDGGRLTNYAADMGYEPQGVGGAVLRVTLKKNDYPRVQVLQ